MVIKEDLIVGPQGKWKVSTVQTVSGGAPDSQPTGSPFKASDFKDETPWPFETMVFKEIGVSGFYHKAYASRSAAIDGHEEVVQRIKFGTLEIGRGVHGPFGVPSLRHDEWNAGSKARPRKKRGKQA